jgi:hypothetical protein
MDLTLGVRPGDDGTVVAVSGEVDVCTEAPLQQALLRIMREHGARLLLDVSGVSSYPMSWILAMGTSADAGQAELLFDLLENDGAARITLGPLDLAA